VAEGKPGLNSGREYAAASDRRRPDGPPFARRAVSIMVTAAHRVGNEFRRHPAPQWPFGPWYHRDSQSEAFCTCVATSDGFTLHTRDPNRGRSASAHRHQAPLHSADAFAGRLRCRVIPPGMPRSPRLAHSRLGWISGDPRPGRPSDCAPRRRVNWPDEQTRDPNASQSQQSPRRSMQNGIPVIGRFPDGNRSQLSSPQRPRRAERLECGRPQIPQPARRLWSGQAPCSAFGSRCADALGTGCRLPLSVWTSAAM
jgi:hypothetical protein